MAWAKRKDIMLCQPMDDVALERLFSIQPIVVCQPKLDGERAWVRWEEGGPLLISSTGTVIHSVPHINYALSKMAEATSRRLQFDGELWVKGRSFEQISSVVSRTANLHPDYTEVEYHIFDIKLLEVSQVQRLINLGEALAEWRLECSTTNTLYLEHVLQAVPYKIATLIKTVHENYVEYIQDGYEGIVVRHPFAFYKCGRPWYVLKFKPKRSDTYFFVAFEEATTREGAPLGRVGAVLCKDEVGNTFRVGTGAGLTHFDLQRLWEERDRYDQCTLVRVEYQNLTETGGVPRFGKLVEVLQA